MQGSAGLIFLNSMDIQTTNTPMPFEVRKGNAPWSKALISDVVAKIKENGIVPIIGYGVFYAEKGERHCAIQEYIVECVLERVGKTFKADDSLRQKYCNGIKGMTALARDMGRAHLNLKTTLEGLYREKAFYEHIKITNEVVSFLKKGRFPLIISTVNFSFVTSILGNLGMKYDLVSYQAENSKDIELNDRGGMKKNTVMNLFGSVQTMSYSVVTESEFLHCLHKLHDKDSTAMHLKTYLTRRYILSLGCEVPDWTFRFLLYSLKVKDQGESLRNENGGDNSFVGGSICELFEDDLAVFLKDINYQFAQNQTDTLRSICHELKPENRTKVFLSMSSDDYNGIGEELKAILQETYDVWLFKNDGGIQYWNDIDDGIRQCRYFVPVITKSSYIKLLQLKDINNINADVDSGLIYEWTMALRHMRECRYVENKEIYAIPYFTEQVNPDDFKRTLLDKDTKKDKLWNLFYSGTASIVGEFTLEKFNEYTKKEEQ